MNMGRMTRDAIRGRKYGIHCNLSVRRRTSSATELDAQSDTQSCPHPPRATLHTNLIHGRNHPTFTPAGRIPRRVREWQDVSHSVSGCVSIRVSIPGFGRSLTVVDREGRGRLCGASLGSASALYLVETADVTAFKRA